MIKNYRYSTNFRNNSKPLTASLFFGNSPFHHNINLFCYSQLLVDTPYHDCFKILTEAISAEAAIDNKKKTRADLTIIYFVRKMLAERKILLSLNSLTTVSSICSDVPVPIFSEVLDFEHVFACRAQLIPV